VAKLAGRLVVACLVVACLAVARLVIACLAVARLAVAHLAVLCSGSAFGGSNCLPLPEFKYRHLLNFHTSQQRNTEITATNLLRMIFYKKNSLNDDFFMTGAGLLPASHPLPGRSVSNRGSGEQVSSLLSTADL
jgi:hypothetical protein